MENVTPPPIVRYADMFTTKQHLLQLNILSDRYLK